MTDRDNSILEEPEKMCEHCCNFDKEHIGMDGTALCKLTMTLAYAEDYGGNCMFYNVPKEQIIIPPCKVGDIVYAKYSGTNEIEYYVIEEVTHLGSDCFQFEAHLENEDGYTVDTIEFTVPEISLTVFLTKEEAEQALAERKENGSIS